MLKLLIVDDSALVRRVLREIFAAEGDFEIASCKDGKEALETLHRLQPDVIILDVVMPQMDGLEALSRIMVERPTPVVMVSSLTEAGALPTLEALALGAVDFIAKPPGTISLNIEFIEQELIEKVRTAARVKLKTRPALVDRMRAERQRIRDERQTRPAKNVEAETVDGVVLIGISTGGPRTLEDILPTLPADFPWPVVVAQHMPGTFTPAFAQRMDEICQLPVCEVNKPTPVQASTIYIAKGSGDIIFGKRSKGLVLLARPESPKYLWHPSVDLLVSSAMDFFPAEHLIGVLMTGMGNDGAETMAKLYQAGGRTIAESEESSIVFGMPADLIKRKGATAVLAADKVIPQLKRWVQ